jgi:hypothetical protein
MGSKTETLAPGDPGYEDTAKTTPDASDYSNIDSLGTLLDSIPELAHLVDQALSGQWTANKFQNEVENSKWWRNHSDTARQVIIQRANDPKAFQQNLGNTTNTVVALARQLGFTVDRATAQAIANHALMTGNNSSQDWLERQLGKRQDYSHVKNISTLQGQMATVASQLSEAAAQYGMNWTAAQIAQRAQNVVQGNTTSDTYVNQLKSWAKSAFPALAKEIDSGMTVHQLADPYVQSMSQLLEVDPGSLSLYTPAIRRALQGTQDPKTKDRVTMNLSDFEDQVRGDPRWAYTQNAKDTMSSALLKLGADFGFGPGG